MERGQGATGYVLVQGPGSRRVSSERVPMYFKCV